MSNPYFSFKQFTVYHDRCAMKVGVDGVLLGAWVDVSGAHYALDIGTGTGLIALMLAQRCGASVTAIDIDAEAVEQSRENIAASQWKSRIEVRLQDICTYQSDTLYDVIVSNPPYFHRSTKCPNGQRNTARHTDNLDFEDLIAAVNRLLHPAGAFSVIIPTDGMQFFLDISTRYGLYPSRCTWVHTKQNATPKRMLLAFKRLQGECVTDDLTIELEPQVFSKEYIALTHDFYLKM